MDSELKIEKLNWALVLSRLDYCSTVYFNISGDLKEQIQRLQNKCIKYVTGLQRGDHVTPARRQLGWLTTEMRRMYFSAIIIYKARRIGQPKYLADFWNVWTYWPWQRWRHPRAQITILVFGGLKSLVYECAKFWDELLKDCWEPKVVKERLERSDVCI